jgi:hypothetical protein
MKKDFVHLLERLVQAEVDFVLVGGFAGVVYGCTYVTQDIDICCDFAGENLLRLQKALSETHPVHRMTPGRQKLELNENNCSGFKNLYLDTDMGQLDCLSFIDGVGDFEHIKNASVLIKVSDMQIRVLSLDALIASKKALNRPRDQEAVRQLEAIKELNEHNHD